ncbi:ATP-dependent helicase [Janthinobacterium sp. SUN206]|uniref:ATP-dependent helicase n=1 Tax=Janthinobacterium sp. SUN206 TaxID=3014787 RepID=UPI0027136429|nr:ATP-dependent helicase [Janthinobacterium sp. SUN206]MDO8065448.1 ATP-dependent helicase [Janthinobacterium sp. SUN206]
MISVDRWSPSDGLSLEPNALAAARETVRNLALTAGPGAGKTEMLAQRADFLLRTGTCRYPKRILAISFKVDASKNLKARVKKRCGDDLASRLDSHTFHAFAMRIITRYRTALTGANALDADFTVGHNRLRRKVITFDDMVPLAVQIIESNLIARNAIRQTYSHVFLDEFQDCTDTQYRLIKACFFNTGVLLTAVGDTKQRIMGWAGALEGIFRTYAADFGALPLNLYQNFRSQPRLRRMQNAMVRVMDLPAAIDDNDIPGDEGEIDVWRFDIDDAEAAHIADTVRQWIDNDGLDPSEIAVLVSKQQSAYCVKLCAALNNQGIPFREEDASQNLAAEPVAQLVVDFLLIVSGQRQPRPYRRLLDVVVFGQGFDEEREYQARARWNRFVANIRLSVSIGAVDLTERADVAAIVRELLDTIGRDAVVAMSHEYGHGQRLAQLIEEIVDRVHNLLEDGSNPVSALASFAGDQAVRIMSIHKSKGLEFDTVIVLGVENQTFWGSVEAERSAYFVAVSRAKRRLFLTTCDHRDRPDGVRRWDAQRTEQEEFIGYALGVIV